jgi:hypothetical protein
MDGCTNCQHRDGCVAHKTGQVLMLCPWAGRDEHPGQNAEPEWLLRQAVACPICGFTGTSVTPYELGTNTLETSGRTCPCCRLDHCSVPMTLLSAVVVKEQP